MATNLRVCVVGAGLIGPNHIERPANRIEGAEVSVVVDADLSRVKKAAEPTPSAAAVSNLAEALNREDVNAVLIATPGFLHRDMLLQVLERDLPILCEKPLTLRDIITSGKLGELLMLHWSHRVAEVPKNFTNEMLINDAVVHEFDVIRYLTGEEIKNVQVRLGRVSRHAHPGQHSPQHVLIEIENGVLAAGEIFVNAQFGYQVATQAG